MTQPHCGAKGETIALAAIATPRFLKIVSTYARRVSLHQAALF
jgi:hypothetical protein